MKVADAVEKTKEEKDAERKKAEEEKIQKFLNLAEEQRKALA